MFEHHQRYTTNNVYKGKYYGGCLSSVSREEECYEFLANSGSSISIVNRMMKTRLSKNL